MRAVIRAAQIAGLALVVSACGGPAAPPPPPKAAAPAPPANVAADAKGKIDAAKSAAGAATSAVAGRQAAATDPKAATAPAATAPAPGTVAATTAATALSQSAPKYEAKGRRDPFESLEARLGSDRSSVSNAKLTGVIHSGGTSFALVETSDGIGYILKPGDTLADGRLLEIGPTVAVFSIAPKPGTTNNRVVLKLASD
jgi:hypothetical protein